MHSAALLIPEGLIDSLLAMTCLKRDVLPADSFSQRLLVCCLGLPFGMWASTGEPHELISYSPSMSYGPGWLVSA